MQRYNYDNVRINSPLFQRGFKLETQTLILKAGNNLIDKNFAPIVLLDADGADRTVLLPLETDCRGLTLALMNVTSTANFTITLKSNNGVTTVAQMLSGATTDLNKHLMFTCDGTRWWPVGNNGGVLTVNGIVFTLDMKFKQNVVYINQVASNLSSILQVTRAGVATYTDLDGVLTDVPANTPRIGNRGLLIERTATNIVRNSTNVGAAAGSPGTNPTTWTVNLNGNVGTLAISVAGSGIANGLPYTDFTVAGTPTGAGFFQAVFAPGATADVAVATGDVLTASAYLQIVAGSLTGLSAPVLAINENTSAGVFVTNGSGAAVLTNAMQRYSHTRTLSGGGTVARAAASFAFSYFLTPVNITFRIGGVQLETGPLATSFIPTSTVAVTRNADQVKVTGSPVTAGIGAGTAFTIFAEYEAQISSSASYVWGLSNDAAPSSADVVYSSVSTSRTGQGIINSGGANQFSNTAAALNVPPLLNRVAMRVAANDAAISHNGAVAIPDPSITMPATTLDRIVLGSSPGAIGLQNLNGHLTRLAAVPLLLSDANLQAVSI